MVISYIGQGDMTLSDSNIGKNNDCSDMGLWHFLNSTGDRGNIKQQIHVTLAFLKIDMRRQDPPSWAPILMNENLD